MVTRPFLETIAFTPERYEFLLLKSNLLSGRQGRDGGIHPDFIGAPPFGELNSPLQKQIDLLPEGQA
jgi:hypothetical protein